MRYAASLHCIRCAEIEGDSQLSRASEESKEDSSWLQMCQASIYISCLQRLLAQHQDAGSMLIQTLLTSGAGSLGVCKAL